MISIVTPSYNMLQYIRQCHASVADQGDVLLEHIIVDAKSTDGTVSWLETVNFPKLKYCSEKDNGMYDAINKGFRLAKGDIIGHLNADEQYLEGTLSFVQNYFDLHPDVDFIAGDMILVNDDGSPRSFRKGMRPSKNYILSSYLYLPTCTIFYRRNIIDKGYFFDDTFKNIGDMEYIVRLLNNGFKSKYVRKYLSVFLITGNNLSMELHPHEDQIINKLKSKWLQNTRYIYNSMRLLEKLLSGSYYEKLPLEYCIYDQALSGRKKYSLTKMKFKY